MCSWNNPCYCPEGGQTLLAKGLLYLDAIERAILTIGMVHRENSSSGALTVCLHSLPQSCGKGKHERLRKPWSLERTAVHRHIAAHHHRAGQCYRRQGHDHVARVLVDENGAGQAARLCVIREGTALFDNCGDFWYTGGYCNLPTRVFQRIGMKEVSTPLLTLDRHV